MTGQGVFAINNLKSTNVAQPMTPVPGEYI